MSGSSKQAEIRALMRREAAKRGQSAASSSNSSRMLSKTEQVKKVRTIHIIAFSVFPGIKIHLCFVHCLFVSYAQLKQLRQLQKASGSAPTTTTRETNDTHTNKNTQPVNDLPADFFEEEEAPPPPASKRAREDTKSHSSQNKRLKHDDNNSAAVSKQMYEQRAAEAAGKTKVPHFRKVRTDDEEHDGKNASSVPEGFFENDSGPKTKTSSDREKNKRE